MGYIFLIISWFLRTYGAVQEQRNPLETPLVLYGDTVKTLIFFIWIALLAIGFYIIFSTDGLAALVISIILYFVVAPILFGKLFKKIMDKFRF